MAPTVPVFRLSDRGELGVWDDRRGAGTSTGPANASHAPPAAYANIMRHLAGAAAADTRVCDTVVASVEIRCPPLPETCDGDSAETRRLKKEARRDKAVLRHAVASRQLLLARVKEELHQDPAMCTRLLSTLCSCGAPTGDTERTIDDSPPEAWLALHERLRRDLVVLTDSVSQRDEDRKHFWKRREAEERAKAAAAAAASEAAAEAGELVAAAEARVPAGTLEGEAAEARRDGRAELASAVVQAEAPAGEVPVEETPGNGSGADPRLQGLTSKYLNQFIAVAWRDNAEDDPEWYNAYVQDVVTDATVLLYYGETNEQESIDSIEFETMVAAGQVKLVDVNAVDFSSWVIVPQRVAVAPAEDAQTREASASVSAKRKRD